MQKKFKVVSLFLIAIILIVGLKLRTNNYNIIPFPGESMDEYSYSWVGLSLIQIGLPVGISGISGYSSNDYRYINVDRVFQSTARGNPFTLNYPWFDHPSLLGLLTGGFAYYKGAKVFEDTSVTLIRKPMIALGVLAILLTAVYAYLIFGYKEALLAAAIYATSPLAIIGSRMIQGENGFIPLFLMSLIFILLYFKTGREVLLWLSALFAGLSILFKLSGVVSIISVSLLIVYYSHNNYKKMVNELLIFGVVSLSFLLIFIVYGLSYDPKIFLDVFRSNSNRFYGIGSNAVYDLLTSVKITNQKYLTDGWYLAGWISVLALLIKNDLKREKCSLFVTIPAVSYLMVFFLFGSEPYGWYRFPFLPFLYIGIARMMVSALEDAKSALLAFIVLLIPIGVAIGKLVDINEFQRYANAWRIGVILLLLLFMVNVIIEDKVRLPLKGLAALSLVLVFIWGIYLNFSYFSAIDVDYWLKIT